MSVLPVGISCCRGPTCALGGHGHPRTSFVLPYCRASHGSRFRPSFTLVSSFGVPTSSQLGLTLDPVLQLRGDELIVFTHCWQPVPCLSRPPRCFPDNTEFSGSLFLTLWPCPVWCKRLAPSSTETLLPLFCVALDLFSGPRATLPVWLFSQLCLK